MIELGKYVTLTMVRKSDLGFMLSDGESDILLHFKQSLKEHQVNDKVKVFIYADKERRLTATEIAPTVTLDEPGFVEVVEVMHGIGVFANMNTPKDIMISKDYLPYSEEAWPHVGEKIFVNLKTKKDTLMAKPMNRFDIIALKKNVNYEEKEVVGGSVIKVSDAGIGIITNDLMYVFVPAKMLRGNYHLGEVVDVTITKKVNDEYYGSLIKNKEEMIDPDKQIILDYLDLHHGAMKITAKTSAEIIEKEFKISRKAFKRAYGALYKERKIDFDDDKTFIVR